MPLTTHAGVQGKSIGLGDAFQSGIRPVEWAEGANHEGFATLLRADGDPIRHGTAQDMRHGIRLVCGIEFQPGALGVLLQQALSFQAATDTLADKLNQILQLVFNRRFEALNLQTGEVDNSIGAPQLSAVWTDPQFDPGQSAFYYVRVLQIPTVRHSLLDAIALGMEHAGKQPDTIQERAYTSSIWYRPQ